MPQEVRECADLLGRRWQLQILYAAGTGAVRFNEYVEVIGDISARMLTERLRELEQAGLVERIVVQANPPYYEYRLTQRGAALQPVVQAMQQAAEVWVQVDVEVQVQVETRPAEG